MQATAVDHGQYAKMKTLQGLGRQRQEKVGTIMVPPVTEFPSEGMGRC